MLTGDLHATRDSPDPAQESLAPAMGPAPDRLAASLIGESRLSRWGRIVPSTAVSVIAHVGLAILFIVVWRSMVRDLTAPPEPISVEIVHAIPGEEAKPAEAAPKSQASPSEPPKAPAQKPAALPLPAPVAPLPAPEPPAPAPPPPPAPEPPPPSPDPQPPAHASPTPPPVTPETQPHNEETPGTPPLKGALLEPPPEPKAAATQQDKPDKANAAEDPTPSPVSPEAVRTTSAPVLAAQDADTLVKRPETVPGPPKAPKASDPDRPTSKDATAHLAAALPMSSMPMPLSFRAMLSSAGSSESQEYKGAVYGVLSRAQQRVDGDARQRKLKGQVVLAITLAENGAVEKVLVVQSSGRADVDAFALAMIHTASPFPPPPPGASRTFTPAITFGDDDAG